MAGLQDSNVTVDLADSAVWDPGNHSNTSSALLSRPICLTMPLTSPAPQDFPGCQDGGNPYLAACYVRKMYHDVFLNMEHISFLYIPPPSWIFGEKLQFFHLPLVSSQQSPWFVFGSWPGITAPNTVWWFSLGRCSAHFQLFPVWWTHRLWPGKKLAVLPFFFSWQMRAFWTWLTKMWIGCPGKILLPFRFVDSLSAALTWTDELNYFVLTSGNYKFSAW